MLYDVMQEYEVKVAQLARAYRSGQVSSKTTRGLMARAWRWCKSVLARDARRELIAERA